MQFLANSYGATVQRQHGEVGAVKMLIHADHPFFGFLPETFESNAAHYESASNLPKLFEPCAFQRLLNPDHRSQQDQAVTWGFSFIL
jgi:GMP synthase-like glutamine amidotransferase